MEKKAEPIKVIATNRKATHEFTIHERIEAGVQLVGRLGADGLLLQLAAQLEEARPWFHRYADLDPALTGTS